jgi:hypothetical protein
MYACEERFTKLITLLEYRFGKLVVRDADYLIQTSRSISMVMPQMAEGKNTERSVLDSR